MVLLFKAMRLSIGSVVVVLVAEKGRVWVCRFFAENTIRRRRMEIFRKTGGLNLQNLKTRIYLCHQNSNTERKGLILNRTKEKEKLLYINNSALLPKAIKRSLKSWAMAKTSVDAEWKVARSVRRQGERSEMKYLLLCAVLKVTEWKKCYERVRRNVWNEVTGSTGTLFENLDGTGKGKCDD